MPQMRDAVGLPCTPRRPPLRREAHRFDERADRAGRVGVAEQDAVDAGREHLLEHPRVARGPSLSSVPFTGTLTMTAGVLWPLLVGPPFDQAAACSRTGP